MTWRHGEQIFVDEDNLGYCFFNSLKMDNRFATVYKLEDQPSYYTIQTKNIRYHGET